MSKPLSLWYSKHNIGGRGRAWKQRSAERRERKRERERVLVCLHICVCVCMCSLWVKLCFIDERVGEESGSTSVDYGLVSVFYSMIHKEW